MAKTDPIAKSSKAKTSNTTTPTSIHIQAYQLHNSSNVTPIDLTDDLVTPNPIPTENFNISTFYPPNTLMCNTKMNAVVTQLQRFYPHEVYIA